MQRTNLDPLFNELKPMASVFDELINNGISTVLGASLATMPPRTNIVETGEAFEIEIAAPGLKKEDFQLNLERSSLTISIEVSKTKDEKKNFIRREYQQTSFEKSFDVPENVDVPKISAIYENGVLLITLPKLNKEDTNWSRTIDID